MKRLAIFAFILLAGCGGPSTAKPAASTTPSASFSASTTPAAVSTSCPPAGTARAAALTSLAMGTHPTIVYATEPPANGGPVTDILVRYDIATASGTEILRTGIGEAQVSPDGQWIGFTTSAQIPPAVQLVRMDGNGMQTLYCGEPNGNIRGLLWSPDQKWLLFSATGASGPSTVYLLDTANGTLQAELRSNDPSIGYAPLSWLDDTRLYVVGRPTGPGPGFDLRVLDLGRGAKQQSSDLPRVLSTSAQCWDADSDGTTLYSSQCSGFFSDKGGGVWRGPSNINAQPATGGQNRTIFTSQTLAVTQLRAAGRSQLLLSVGNQDPAQSAAATMNGLWKVNADGSGLTRLVASPGKQGQFNVFSQAAWANVSRDGSLYAFQVSSLVKVPSYALVFGPLAGGQPTTVAARADGGQLLIIGWTTT